MATLAPTIVIIEDSPFFRVLFSRMLQKLWPAIQINAFEDGSGIIEWLDTCKPDIIFMDIHLPSENGIELTKRIKAICPETPIIIVTGHSFHEYGEAAQSAGADAFLQKDQIEESRLRTIFDSLVFV